MSEPIDVTSEMFRMLKAAHDETSGATSGKLASKPKAIKVPGNSVHCVLLGKRQGKKNDWYRVLVVGEFSPSDVNPAAGNWVSPDQIEVYVFEKHSLQPTEMEELRNNNMIGKNQTYSNRKQIGCVELRKLEIIEVQSFTPWMVNSRMFEVGDYVRMDSLVREQTETKGQLYTNWKCENVSAFVPTPFQTLEIRALIESARTRLVSLRYTPETESLPVPEHLIAALKEERNRFTAKEIEKSIRFERMTQEQKDFVLSAIAIPFTGISEALAQRFGVMMTNMEFAVTSKEATTQAGKVTYADIVGTVFVTQIKGGKLEKVQVGINFTKDIIASIGILHTPNLLAFGKQLLSNSSGCVWGVVDPINSTNDTAIAVDEKDVPLADYPIWIDAIWLNVDLVAAVMKCAFEITPDLARRLLRLQKYDELSTKYAPGQTRKFGEDIYIASESKSGVDPEYRYFMMHPFYDDSRLPKLHEVQEEREWSDEETIARFCSFISTNDKSELKPTDFKRLVDAGGKFIEDEANMATIFGIKKDAIDKPKKAPSSEEVLKIYEEAQREYNALMASFYDPQPLKRVDEENEAPAKRQKIDDAIPSD
jgi:hypothetical protein